MDGIYTVTTLIIIIRKMPNACSITLVAPRLIHPFGRPRQIPVPYVNLIYIS